MKTFPLVRAKWSNEHVMAALFVVLILYLSPLWIDSPKNILSFLAVLLFSLVLDAVINIVRYKKPTCAVSAAVSAAVLQILAPEVPLLGQLFGAAAALLIGKHIWGGTGRNPINPAITGLLLMSLLFDIGIASFKPSYILIPAILLSLPFVRFRPFAAISFMAGMATALLFNQELSISAIISYGIFFWGCVVITDPVTTTMRPLLGAISGLAAGFLPVYFFGTTTALAAGILGVNIVSYALDKFDKTSNDSLYIPFNINKYISFSENKGHIQDLVREEDPCQDNVVSDSKDTILKRIEANEVFGFGGAAFPVYKKIRTVMDSDAPEKHLIINGVECDPGLIHDKWLLRQYPEEICKGIELVCKCESFASVTLAVKDAKGLLMPEDLKIHRVPGYYPVGAEGLLIKTVLDKTIPHNEIPAKSGILVLNVQTLFYIYEAVCKNKKADSRFLTLADIRNMSRQIVKVRLGTKIRDVAASVYPGSGHAFCGGGLMQSKSVCDEDIVDKSVNFIAVGNFPNYKESVLCSKCGFCVERCPAGLKVNEIAHLVDAGRFKEAKSLHAEKCMGCGSCSFVCLAGKNLSARMKTAKEYIHLNPVTKGQ
ncbi:MAG: RnfABCDGE type electron transport complex subunit D [Clostridia bacterium]|nr:RnfABCDGE type electron transport complex subunit D [Clostridia bacterium]